MKFLPILLITIFGLVSCNKDNDSPIINFGPNGGIEQRTANGSPIGSSDPTDWTMDGAWNGQEQALFKSLNFDLNGAQPGGIRDIVLYPNPVTTEAHFYLKRPNGTMQVAWVVVDQKYRVVRELVKDSPVQATGTTYRFDFSSLEKEKIYRMYYVLYSGSALIGKGHGDIKMVI